VPSESCWKGIKGSLDGAVLLFAATLFCPTVMLWNVSFGKVVLLDTRRSPHPLAVNKRASGPSLCIRYACLLCCRVCDANMMHISGYVHPAHIATSLLDRVFRMAQR